MGGLEAAYGFPRRDGVSRTVVVVTDGYVGVEAKAFRFIRERLGEANLFAFGIGSSVNRGLIEGMARAGQGEPFVVLQPDKARGQAEKLRATIEQPVLSHVRVAFTASTPPRSRLAKVPDLMARGRCSCTASSVVSAERAHRHLRLHGRRALPPEPAGAPEDVRPERGAPVAVGAQVGRGAGRRAPHGRRRRERRRSPGSASAA